MSTEEIRKEIGEMRIFWFVVYITTTVFAYIFAVTFLHIPKENMRFVDIAFGFLLGTVMGSGIGYLLGGSPEKKKDTTINGDNNTLSNTTGGSEI